MTERELHKLRRQELLELLIMQSREATRVQAELEKLKIAYEERESSYNRLKTKLNEKDQQIEKLIQRLDAKDAQIKLLQSGEGSAAEAAARPTAARPGDKEARRAAADSEAQPKRSGGHDLAQLLVKVYDSSKEKLAKSEETIALLRQQLADRDAAKDSLRSMLEQSDTTVALLRQQLADRDAAKDSLQSMLEQSEETIALLRQRLADRDAAMDTLRYMLEKTQQAEIDTLQNLSDSLRRDRTQMLALLQQRDPGGTEAENDLPQPNEDGTLTEADDDALTEADDETPTGADRV